MLHPTAPYSTLGLTFLLLCVPCLTLRDICLALSTAILQCFLIRACERRSLHTAAQKQHHARHSMNTTSPTPRARQMTVSSTSVNARGLKQGGGGEGGEDEYTTHLHRLGYKRTCTRMSIQQCIALHYTRQLTSRLSSERDTAPLAADWCRLLATRSPPDGQRLVPFANLLYITSRS